MNQQDPIEQILLQYAAELHHGLNELAGRGTPTEQAATAIRRLMIEERIATLEAVRKDMTLFPPNGVYSQSMFAVTVNDIDDRIEALKKEKEGLK
jgi:hypothetical protein